VNYLFLILNFSVGRPKYRSWIFNKQWRPLGDFNLPPTYWLAEPEALIFEGLSTEEMRTEKQAEGCGVMSQTAL
jgi:hypothetical protein